MNNILSSIFKRVRDENIIFAFAFFLSISFLFTIWVHHAFQGNYWGPFLPGAHFGIPEREAAMGMYPTSPIGWDAQFYYYQSNDLFAQKDEFKHIDKPPYRYQRIGMPLIAGSIATILGYSITPPWLYHFLQLLLVSIGFYYLLYWLKKHQISRWYALAWPLSIGTLNALFLGMPDPVGDVFFIISLVALFERRLYLYVVVSIFLLLVREGYAVFAGVICLFTLLKRIEWAKCGRLKATIMTALPGIVMSLWMAFVTLRFDKSPLAASANSNLTDYPFVAFFKTFLANHTNNLGFEDFFKVWGLIVLTVGLILALKACWERIEWGAVLAYFILISMLGTTVWFDYSGYMKAFGSILIIVIMLLFYYKKKRFILILLQLFLFITLVEGIGYNILAKKDVFYAEFKPAIVTAQSDNVLNRELVDFSSSIEAINLDSHWSRYQGLFSPFHRSVKFIPVLIKNNSNQTWYPFPQDGLYAINLSYHWYNELGDRILYDGIRTPLLQPVLPGETIQAKLQVMIPPAGKYMLKLSMMQDGVSWFYLAGDKNGATYHVTVE